MHADLTPNLSASSCAVESITHFEGELSCDIASLDPIMRPNSADDDINSPAELAFWLFLLDQGPNRRDWFTSWEYRMWYCGEAPLILHSWDERY